MSDTSTNTNIIEDTGTGTATGLQPYIQQEWSNGEEGKTPISAERLLHMETGIGDLSRTLLDGRLPSYTVTSRDAPAPSTPCILVVVDRTGLYQGTWRDDGTARTQIGWGASGDEERYYFTPTASSSSKVEHTYDYASLTRHGSLVELTGYYHLEPDEQVKTSSHYLNWISVPAAWQPPHDLASLVVPEVISTANSNGGLYLVNGRDYPFVQVRRGNLPSYTVWLEGFYQYLAAVNFHLVWMTDALTAAPGASPKMLQPSPAQTVGSAAMQETAQQTQAQTAPTQTESTQGAAPAADAAQPAPAVQAPAVQAPAVQAPAVQEPASQSALSQEQTPAAQAAASQASAQQEQATTQSPAVQAPETQASSQDPAQASPAHADPEQTPAVQTPAVQNAPALAASTARHAKPGLEE